MSDIHAKITALLEFAKNNPSEEEAASAMQMAQRLMMKWNIEEKDLGHISSVDFGEAHTLDRDYFRILGHAVNYMTGVTMVHYSNETFKLVGTSVNCQIAHALLMFLAEQVESMYKMYLPKGMSKSDRANYRKDFKRNCAARIMQRCKDFKFQSPTTGTALVLMSSQLEKEVEEFLNKQMIRKVISKAKINPYSRGGSDGRMAGDAAAIQKRI